MRKPVFSLALLLAIMMPAQDRHVFTGVITDSMCSTGDHSAMKMGPTDAECTNACIDEHGASYVLYAGKDAYFLDDQKTPEKFAGKKVTATGTLDATKKILHVSAIAIAAGDR